MCFSQRNRYRARPVYMVGVGQPKDIDNSCGHFTAELGKKKKVLGLNLDAVDGDLAQKSVFPDTVNGVARRQACQVRADRKVVERISAMQSA
jgi:hypothetical protein